LRDALPDTIFALASGAGRAGVAVIRLSGPAAERALQELSGRAALPQARRATLVELNDPKDGGLLDRGLALWFPAPASFTGEDVVELHVHGGRAVVGALAEALIELGLRPAEPGEFTRRAFENGKLDLTAAEGLADLVNAETAAQRRQALRQLDGQLGELYESWRINLLGALARLEADIDFPDEDLPDGMTRQARASLTALLGEIGAHLDDGHRGERLRDGFSMVILGAPNVGKSSLLNALARRDAAIVSATAGTTRDVVEVLFDLGGFPVILADTAGLRESSDEIEQEGARRALARAENADLKLVLVEAAAWPKPDASIAALIDANSVVVLTKQDLHRPVGVVALPGREIYQISTRTGEGVERLLEGLTRIVQSELEFGAMPNLTRVRHRHALEECATAIRRSIDAGEAELAAEDIRLAVRALGRITGMVNVEDILDIVFREFCIGK
jgi:tRNA modification GTPase